MSFLQSLQSKAQAVITHEYLRRDETKKAIIMLYFFFVAGLYLSAHYGIYFNISKSFKEQVFIVKKDFDKSEIQRRTIVTVPIKEENPYVPVGKKMVKRVVCVGGDRLTTRGKDFWCGDRHIATASEVDSEGRSITSFEYDGIIPEGHMFIAGDNDRSYDSRYFGFVTKDDVKEIGIWKF